MKKIMFNDKYGLTDAVLQGRKTMTRRVATWETVKEPNTGFLTDQPEAGTFVLCDRFRIVAKSTYKVGEIVAVAQRYIDLCNCSAFYEALAKADPTFPLECIKGEKGCYNKMFVKADWMPHHIRITDIKVERLQDISNEDCLKEGIIRRDDMINSRMEDVVRYTFDGSFERNVWKSYDTPREAFARLIDKVSKKGTWERNPFVFAYTFELINNNKLITK